MNIVYFDFGTNISLPDLVLLQQCNPQALIPKSPCKVSIGRTAKSYVYPVSKSVHVPWFNNRKNFVSKPSLSHATNTHPHWCCCSAVPVIVRRKENLPPVYHQHLTFTHGQDLPNFSSNLYIPENTQLDTRLLWFLLTIQDSYLLCVISVLLYIHTKSFWTSKGLKCKTLFMEYNLTFDWFSWRHKLNDVLEENRKTIRSRQSHNINRLVGLHCSWNDFPLPVWPFEQLLGHLTKVMNERDGSLLPQWVLNTVNVLVGWS